MTRSVKNKISRYSGKKSTSHKRKARTRKSAKRKIVKRVARKKVRRRGDKPFRRSRCVCGKTLTTHLIWIRHINKCPMYSAGLAARLCLDGMITLARWKRAKAAAEQWKREHPEWKPRKRYHI